MTRNYTNVTTSIWDDADFCALSAGAQRTYFMLITQNDITACGMLSLTLRRWSKTCSEKDLDVWLAALSDARFVLIDEDSEELLVRTFVKWDGGYKHPTRAKAVVATARAIRSAPLREAVASELAKLGVSIGIPVPPDSHSEATREPTESLRSVVNVGDHVSTPHSSIREREPDPVDASADAPSMFCSKHPNGTEQKCGPCGTAKMRASRWAKEQDARLRAETARIRAAVAACDRCDEDGYVVDAVGIPLGRCDHRRTA